MTLEKQLFSPDEMTGAIKAVAAAIVSKFPDPADFVLVGLYKQGVPLMEKIAEEIFRLTGKSPQTGKLDITMYRDDLSERPDLPGLHTPMVTDKPLSIDIQNKTVILVDDVIYTGRTIRAAIEALFRQGRPAAVQLAVLVDRGHRELPIRPDYVGKNIPTAREEIVDVHITAIDGDTGVYLI